MPGVDCLPVLLMCSQQNYEQFTEFGVTAVRKAGSD